MFGQRPTTLLLLCLVGIAILGMGFRTSAQQQGMQKPLNEAKPMENMMAQQPIAQPVSAAEPSDFWGDFKRYQYGPAPENHVYLYVPPAGSGQKDEKICLVVLVHGGNYLFGSAKDYSMLPWAEFFRSRGYAVASIGYRTLQQHRWPAPVSDVRQGLTYIHNLLGDQVQETTYVGYSAGAVTGALLLYSEQFGAPDGIDRFIGVSGLYDKEAVSPDPVLAIRQQSLERIDLLAVVDRIHQPKASVPALLIEGRRDFFADRFPYTPRSHASRLAQLLESHKIPAKTFWASASGMDGHDGPIAMLALKDQELITAVDSFLKQPLR